MLTNTAYAGSQHRVCVVQAEGPTQFVAPGKRKGRGAFILLSPPALVIYGCKMTPLADVTT